MIRNHNETTTRRQLLGQAACGFGSLALTGLLSETAMAGSSPLAAKQPHFAPKAKRIIFIFMQGGPSHVDTFQHKPRLDKDNGKKIKFRVARSRKVTAERVMKSPWSFKPYGKCGHLVSELFPNIATHVDDLCFIQSMHTNGVAHGPSTLFLHTGATNQVRPSLGSWISYGLGTENENLPSYMTINPSQGNGGPRNYASAFLPPVHQGISIGKAGQPVTKSTIRHINNDRYPAELRKRQFDLLQALNRQQVSDGQPDETMEAAIESFELAYRMQTAAPDLANISAERPAMLASYGIGKKETDEFGRQCLLARRMAEIGVRYIQVNYADNGDNPSWDQHSNLKLHAKHAKASDKPVAGLLADLKERGLLEDTLVWWGGEFGRNPFAQNNGTGRDHNPDGFTVFLAGGGVKKGFSYGQTDEFGHTAVENKVHMHDLHATVLHLLGMDHEKLTYRYAGRDFRPTDVYGEVVKGIIA